MKIMTRVAVTGIAFVLGSCAVVEKEPLRITPKDEVKSSPVVREILPEPAPIAATPAETPAAASSPAPTLATVAPSPAAPAVVAPPVFPTVPAGTLYVCRGTVNNKLQHTAIEYEPRVKQLCGRHPEMGVCQYERDACRASGGQVFDAAGTEITRQIEAEYDKKVMRVRFRAG